MFSDAAKLNRKDYGRKKGHCISLGTLQLCFPETGTGRINSFLLVEWSLPGAGLKSPWVMWEKSNSTYPLDMHPIIAWILGCKRGPPYSILPPLTLTPQKAYLFHKKSWEEKTLKTNFFHLCWTFLTTVLNQFQTSESIFQNMAHVRKYSFQMEVWSDLVNINLFANSIRKYSLPPSPTCACKHTHVDAHAQNCNYCGLFEIAGYKPFMLWLPSLFTCRYPVTVEEMNSVTRKMSLLRERTSMDFQLSSHQYIILWYLKSELQSFENFCHQ